MKKFLSIKCLPFRIFWLFSSEVNKNFQYKELLSQHIVKIMESKPHLYGECEKKFMHLIEHANKNITLKENNKAEQMNENLKIKLNMIFRVYSLPQVLFRYKQQLSDRIADGWIKNQSDLDKITNLLLKNVKINKQYSLKDIEQLRKQQQKDREKFDKQIQKLMKSNQKIEISQVSKIMREKFMNIESKEIYNRLKAINDKVAIIGNKNNDNQANLQQKQKSVKQFWDKLQNIKPRLIKQQLNDPQIYKKHLQITQNKFRFRFPPQPNGYLHIGHVKSMRINFETAKRYGGLCYLRYDDTNPETQSHEYIDNILKNVRWLGYEPDKITYASDYFQDMLRFAIQLIKEGHAYVCDSSQIEIQRERKQKIPNKYRERSIQQSLKMFPNLQEGQTLRLKLDPAAKNPTLRDPVIYRIKEHSHPRTGNKYRIYPIYDFAHCICDSLEHIDYSLCSLQFEVRRELYYKILDLLKLYKPSVWQYSRLNVEGSVISKRKIKALIQNHTIHSWSDPRLLTIGGLINRGYTPSMVINFIDKINASRAGNQNIVQFSLLQREMRKELFKTSQKSMMVLNPTKVQIENMGQNEIQTIKIELYTDPQKKQTRNITLSKIVFIQKDESDLEIGKIIVLKYYGVFQITSKSENSVKVKKLNENVKDLKESKKQYKIVHWISQKDCHQHKVTVFDRLLNQKQQLNSNSKTIYHNALIPIQIHKQKENIDKYWQMERLGYFKFSKQGEFIRCTSLNQK